MKKNITHTPPFQMLASILESSLETEREIIHTIKTEWLYKDIQSCSIQIQCPLNKLHSYSYIIRCEQGVWYLRGMNDTSLWNKDKPNVSKICRNNITKTSLPRRASKQGNKTQCIIKKKTYVMIICEWEIEKISAA